MCSVACNVRLQFVQFSVWSEKIIIRLNYSSITRACTNILYVKRQTKPLASQLHKTVVHHGPWSMVHGLGHGIVYSLCDRHSSGSMSSCRVRSSNTRCINWHLGTPHRIWLTRPSRFNDFKTVKGKLLLMAACTHYHRYNIIIIIIPQPSKLSIHSYIFRCIWTENSSIRLFTKWNLSLHLSRLSFSCARIENISNDTKPSNVEMNNNN